MHKLKNNKLHRLKLLCMNCCANIAPSVVLSYSVINVWTSKHRSRHDVFFFFFFFFVFLFFVVFFSTDNISIIYFPTKTYLLLVHIRRTFSIILTCLLCVFISFQGRCNNIKWVYGRRCSWYNFIVCHLVFFDT